MAKTLTSDAPKIGICDFGPFSETYFAEILGGCSKVVIKQNNNRTEQQKKRRVRQNRRKWRVFNR